MKNLPDDLPPGIITGEPVMLHDAFNFLEDDGRRLMITTTLLLGAVILCCFRSLWWVAIPLLVVQLALIMTRAFLYVSQVQLTMVSSMLTAVVTVVGVATVVHVIVCYREGLTQGMAPRRALTQTLERLAAPVSWACITDAAGFGALLAASVAPVRAFGLMMAVGSLAVLVSCALLVPALALMGPAAWIAKDHSGDRFLNRRLLGMFSLVNRFPVPVALITVTGSLLACLGIARLTTETDFTRNFRSSTEIVKSYEVVESKLGGAGVFDIFVPAPAELTWPYLVKLLRMEQQLRKEVQVQDASGKPQPGLTKVLSLADAIYRGAATDLQRVRRERLRQRMINAGLKSMRDAIPEFFDALYTTDPQQPDEHYFRILLRATERQPSEQKQQIIAQVREKTRESFPDGQVTGYFVLLTNLIDSILRDQWRHVWCRLGRDFLYYMAGPSPGAAGPGRGHSQCGSHLDRERHDGLAGPADQHGGRDDRRRFDGTLHRRIDPLPAGVSAGAAPGGGGAAGPTERATNGRPRHGLFDLVPGRRFLRPGHQPVHPHRLLRDAGQPLHVVYPVRHAVVAADARTLRGRPSTAARPLAPVSVD